MRTIIPENKSYWFALYTYSRCEKKVSQELERRNFKYYLPIRKTLRQWSDRKKWVNEPLFSSYIFVSLTEDLLHKVLQIPNVVGPVSISRVPVKITNEQIRLISEIENNQEIIEEFNGVVESGTKVKVLSGPFMGFVGHLISKGGRKRVVIQVEGLGLGAIVEIGKGIIRPC